MNSDPRAVKVVDSTEPGEIRQVLLERGWQQKRLYSGDYAFWTCQYQKVGITRKTVADLLNSIGGLFSKQLEEMLDNYGIRIILLEGSWRHVAEGNIIIQGIRWWTWDIVWNYLRRWQDKGFTLELTTSMSHTVDRLNKLYALYQKPYSLSANTRGFTDDRILALPSGVRGKTGQKVLDTFGSLKQVANAVPEQLVRIDKIGEKKAQLIYDHFNKGENNESMGTLMQFDT